MLDEQYMYSIEKMIEEGHFRKGDGCNRCNYCNSGICGCTVFETEGAMRIHLEEEHGIKVE